ncbi:histidine phosphatase family protein [Ureibacillus aquaedulcis]|uniref:Histidine phosphatase family protein n=1 Tax=Ureibacillus aquaedulcis TaxID=3058421 RepID=A0ABT8GMD8_9BACL|nr:histidine phosphatase family protein [Ureibacillus sp. BA0131]MDN4492590.1 histidine phosphatase family protein [Ureibacillus sp. BA0131]
MNRLLLHDLRNGGYIFYTRHGEATIGRDSNLDFRNCFTQRNLSEKGRWQAIYYGEILRYLGIPIKYPISASPFCRTIETAQLAVGTGNVQVDPFWIEVNRLSGNLSSEERQRILNRLQSVLELKPEAGKNNIVIAHSFPEGAGLGRIRNMETIIIKPRGVGNGYEVIDQLSLSDLSKLGESFNTLP